MEKIKPLKNLVVVELTPAETQTASGIIIPDTAKEKPQQGTIVAIGNSVEDVKTGDKVLYGKYLGIEVGRDLLLIRESDIIAVL